MTDDILYQTDKECKDMLQYIFRDALQLNNKIAPEGWKHSEFVSLLHPTAYKNVYSKLPDGYPFI